SGPIPACPAPAATRNMIGSRQKRKQPKAEMKTPRQQPGRFLSLKTKFSPRNILRAIRGERCTCDETRHFISEEGDAMGDLLRLAKPTNGNRCDDAFKHLLRHSGN